MSTILPISIDDILQSTAIGSLDKAIGNNLYGFNHEQLPNAVPYNRERQGFLFFVRPQLNLQLDNIRNARKFSALAQDVFNSANASIHRFVRTTLDPRLMVGYRYGQTSTQGTAPSAGSATPGNGTSIPVIDSVLTNNNMAFIPVLTNNAMTSSGWPDPTVPTYTSKPGRYNESITFVDGLVENFEKYTVDVTFRNTVSDPILYMFYIWNLYMSYVYNGRFVPYPDFIVNQRIDYNTRLYRVRLDRNRYKVTKIMSTGPAIPVGSSVGQFGDMNMDETYSSANKEITIRFETFGFEIFDDKLIEEFNATVQMFKSEMQEANRASQMILVPRSIGYIFQHRAYPRINPDNHVMEWWVDKALFDQKTQAFLNALQQQDAFDAEQADQYETQQINGAVSTANNDPTTSNGVSSNMNNSPNAPSSNEPGSNEDDVADTSI